MAGAGGAWFVGNTAGADDILVGTGTASGGGDGAKAPAFALPRWSSFGVAGVGAKVSIAVRFLEPASALHLHLKQAHRHICAGSGPRLRRNRLTIALASGPGTSHIFVLTHANLRRDFALTFGRQEASAGPGHAAALAPPSTLPVIIALTASSPKPTFVCNVAKPPPPPPWTFPRKVSPCAMIAPSVACRQRRSVG